MLYQKFSVNHCTYVVARWKWWWHLIGSKTTRKSCKLLFTRNFLTIIMRASSNKKTTRILLVTKCFAWCFWWWTEGEEERVCEAVVEVSLTREPVFSLGERKVKFMPKVDDWADQVVELPRSVIRLGNDSDQFLTWEKHRTWKKREALWVRLTEHFWKKEKAHSRI